MDRWTDRHGPTHKVTIRHMKKLKDKQTYRHIDIRQVLNKWRDGEMDRWTDGQMDR